MWLWEAGDKWRHKEKKLIFPAGAQMQNCLHFRKKCYVKIIYTVVYCYVCGESSFSRFFNYFMWRGVFRCLVLW